MSEIFALSLTTKNNNHSSLWKHFADRGRGVKLTFEVESKIPDFREVYYSNRPHPQKIGLLNDLFTEVTQQFGYPLNFTYMSKIGAFFIKGKYINQQEYWFLIKRTSDTYNAWNLEPITYQNEISYIKLPFESDYANFKLVEVEAGRNCDDENYNKIERLINEKYSGVPITKHR